jgi:hypothetical protein
MSKFFMGLALGLLGFLVWAVASVLWAVGDLAKETGSESDSTAWIVIAAIGFAAMIGAPVLYWFILPVIGWIRRRLHHEVTPSAS